jgi:UDP-N-acetylglucosamine 1-carboxyvinyltransferase
MAALMTQAQGTSTLVETVFENRLKHMSELKRMGARVLTDGRMAVINGPSALAGAQVTATDLRSGAALVLAGLAAQGQTHVDGLEVIQRGYQDLARRLSGLGARAWEVS